MIYKKIKATSLNKLAKNIDTTKIKQPSFKMILTGLSNYTYKREDDILIVPVSYLKM